MIRRGFRSAWRHAALLAGVSVVALSAAGAVSAQDSIRVGQTISGSLSQGDSTLPSGEMADDYHFEGQAGQVISLSLASEEFDTWVVLNGPADFWDFNDDVTDGDSNSFLSVRLPATGTYLVRATSYEPGESGAYTLRMVEGEGGDLVDIPDGGGAIAAGQTLLGRLNSTDPVMEDQTFYDDWVLTGTPGASYVARLSSSAFDAFMLINGDDLELTNDDDPTQRGVLNSRIDFVMPESGRVTIQANSVGEGAMGAYSLSVEEAETLSARNAVVAGGSLSVGRSVDGTLSPDGGQLSSGANYSAYSLQGEAGQTIELALTAEDFDPYLSIAGPNGFSAYNDDDLTGENGLNSRLIVTLPSDGEYLVTATSYEVGQTGAFTLAASTATAEPVRVDTRPVVNAETITPATATIAITGTLAEGDDMFDGSFADTFRFTAEAGQPFDVSLTSDDFDAYLVLTTPSGDEVRSDDYEEGSTNSRIVGVLEESGQYQLTATSYEVGETGTYHLTSASGGYGALGANGELGDGDEVDDEGRYVDRYPFVGRAGDPVGINLVSDAFDTRLTLVTPSGERIENDDYGDGTNSRIEYTLTETGDYELEVSSFDLGGTGPYDLISGDADERSVVVGGGQRVFAVMVGISDYGGEQSDLAYTAQDATKMADTLRRQGVLNPASITLTDAEATVDAVRAAFAQVAAQAGPDDVFMFFYSGHGGQMDGTVSPTEPDGMYETLAMRGGMITDSEMAEMFATLNTRMSLLILDSCFSGGFARNVVSRPGVMGLFSSEEDLTSAVPDKFEAGGYMSSYVQEAFTGQGDENGDGLITAGELSSYVRERFRGAGQVETSTSDLMSRNYQYFVVDRGGVRVDDVITRAGSL